MNAPVLQVPSTTQVSALRLWMKGFYWLIKREFWEHQRGLLWAPVVLGVVFSFMGVLSQSVGGLSSMAVLQPQASSVPLALLQSLAGLTDLVTSYFASPVMLCIVPALTAFFYCLDALQDDRRDRSILFWKSLPSSDTATVLSKACVALIFGPLIGWTVYWVAAGIILLGSTGPSDYRHYFGNHQPWQVLGVLPIYILWALPTVGWLLMVSAWTRSRPFLWSVGLPVLIAGLLEWGNAFLHFSESTRWLWSDFVARTLMSGGFGGWMFPGLGGLGGLLEDHGPGVFTASWKLIYAPTLWIGAISGIAMIAIAIRLRRWRTAD